MFENAPPSAGEIRALANQLLSWANHLAARPALGPEPSEDDRRELALSLAIAARESAQRRDRAFPEIDFCNPTWLITLELYIQEASGFRIAPERLPLVAFLPSETVERALGQLQRLRIAEVVAEPSSPAGLWVRLTEDGSRRMTDLLLASVQSPQRHPAREVAQV